MARATTIPTVLIIGSSFVTRLTGEFSKNGVIRSDFNLLQCNVQCFGLSGGTVNSLKHNAELDTLITETQPSCLILQVGGNDMCNTYLQPETLACSINDWMDYLCTHYCSVKTVTFCEIFERTQPRDIPAHVYSYRRSVVNQMLPDLIAASSHKTFFWKHLRLMNSPCNIYHTDGIHLSDLGMKKFYRSLRLAILHALDHLY